MGGHGGRNGREVRKRQRQLAARAKQERRRAEKRRRPQAAAQPKPKRRPVVDVPLPEMPQQQRPGLPKHPTHGAFHGGR